MNVEKVAQLIDYFLAKSYPPRFTKEQKRRLRESAVNFTCRDRILFHKDANGDKRVVVGNVEKEKIVTDAHCGVVGGGHFGQNITIRKVSERYWWKGMANDIRKYCQSCADCQKANPLNKPDVAELHPLPVTSELFMRWGMD